MQARLAIASLILAILLGLLTAWAYAPRAPAPVGTVTPFASFDPLQLTQLVSGVSPESKCARCDTIIRFDDALGMWLYQEDALDGRGPAWPVDEGRVRGFARLLADLARTPVVDTKDAAWTGPSMMVTAGGTTSAFRVAESSLGGSTLVAEQAADQRGEQRLFVRNAAGDWSSLLARPSLGAWRLGGPLLVQAANVNRVAITSAGRRMTLERRDGRWGMLEPMAAPADQAKVAELLEGMARAGAERFLDQGASGEAGDWGLERPAGLIEVGSSLAQADGGRKTLTQTLLIGAAADASAGTYFASARATLEGAAAWGPRALVLSRQTIEAMARDPAVYVSQRSVQSPAADVGAIDVERSGENLGSLVRADAGGSRGWNWVGDAESSAVLPSAGDLAGLRELAGMLCEVNASSVQVLDESQAGATALARLTVRSRARSALEVCDVLVVAATDAAGKASELLGVRVGRVLRVYDGENARRVLEAVRAGAK